MKKSPFCVFPSIQICMKIWLNDPDVASAVCVCKVSLNQRIFFSQGGVTVWVNSWPGWRCSSSSPLCYRGFTFNSLLEPFQLSLPNWAWPYSPNLTPSVQSAGSREAPALETLLITTRRASIYWQLVQPFKPEFYYFAQQCNSMRAGA